MRKCPSCGSEYDDAVAFCGHDGAITIQVQPTDDVDQRLGTRLGDYIVAARVADGAMGRVYEGRHPDSKAKVAIKVLHSDVAEDEVAVERFRREFETAEEFDHPHIVDVHAFGETEDGSYYLTMEFLEGAELSERLREAGTFEPARALRILCQLSSALDYAHSFGVIHRDLKPENVFLCSSPRGDVVKVLDFGSVKLQMETGPKLTAFGTTLGSPYYMSPEQAKGLLDVDQRTDVFAVAAILWEMATGKVAFEGVAVAEILMKIINHQPPGVSTLNASYPAALDAVIDSGWAKDKTLRPNAVGALAAKSCEAFGLEAGVEQIGAMEGEELQRLLSSSTPPAVQAAPASVADAGPSPASSRAEEPMPSLPKAGPKPGLIVAVGLGVAIAVGAVVFVLLG